MKKSGNTKNCTTTLFIDRIRIRIFKSDLLDLDPDLVKNGLDPQPWLESTFLNIPYRTVRCR